MSAIVTSSATSASSASSAASSASSASGAVDMGDMVALGDAMAVMIAVAVVLLAVSREVATMLVLGHQLKVRAGSEPPGMRVAARALYAPMAALLLVFAMIALAWIQVRV